MLRLALHLSLLVSRNAVLEAAPGGTGARRAWIDVARGVAVGAMVVYHGAWDLAELSLADLAVTDALGWRLFARAIAGSFLFLVGIGLALAHPEGLRRTAFLRRLAAVAAAALAVTVATWFAFPESYIFFGVLHNIALSSAIAAAFLRAPPVLTIAVAALVIAAPLWPAPALFDAPLLFFLGLGSVVPVTNDFVPVFPWTGIVLAGLVAGRFLSRHPPVGAVRTPRQPARALAAIGRRSLAVYLLHQPLLFGALFGLRAIVGPDPAAEAGPFVRDLVRQCRAVGDPDAVCRTTADCTVAELKREALWSVYISGRSTPDQVARASELAMACLARAR